MKITEYELRVLLFWALVGFTESNGGTYQKTFPRIAAKYIKELKIQRSSLPLMGIQTKAKLTGKMFDLVKEELKEIYPRTKF